IWQVQRLFARTGLGNRNSQAPADDSGTVIIDPNDRDPIRGTLYGEQALMALQKHATQGPWPKTFADMLRFRGSPDGRLPVAVYRLVREAKGAAPLPKGPKNFLDGLQLPDEIAKQVQPPTIDGRPLTEFINQPERIENALISAEKNNAYGQSMTGARSHASSTDPRLSRVNQNLNQALAKTLGINVTLRSAESVLVPGTKTDFQLVIANNGAKPAN